MWLNKAGWIFYFNNFLSFLTHISRSSELFFLSDIPLYSRNARESIYTDLITNLRCSATYTLVATTFTNESFVQMVSIMRRLSVALGSCPDVAISTSNSHHPI